MPQNQLLNLSVGDQVPDRRLTASAHTDTIDLKGKKVRIGISADAVRAAADSPLPLVAELELYFSCLVRKQLRFRRIDDTEVGSNEFTRVVPGLYTTFRAVTTAHCSIAEAGDKPPVVSMPVRKPERFVPDWIRIDYRAGQWLGEYGFARRDR